MTDNKLIGEQSISRRVFLGGAGAVAGLALTRSRDWLGSDSAGHTIDQLFTTFEQSLTPTQRALTFLSHDHPTRQITLTEAVHKTPHIGTLYNSQQANLIRQMYNRMLSAQGRNWMRNTINLEGRFSGSILKIYSSDLTRPSLENSQLVINGGHYMLRSEDISGSGYALGGPVSYGQQIGNNRYKVEGNAYKAHGDAMHLFHQSLDHNERQMAYQTTAPTELLLQIQGHGAQISGVKIADISDRAKEVAREMLGTLFSGFTTTQQNEAWSAIDDNGGIDSLHVAMYTDFAFYQDGARYSDLNQQQRQARGIPYCQVWRIEGPASVIHFKGFPHVHAYMNIVRDPTRIAVGEALTETQRSLSQTSIRQLISETLGQITGADSVYYPDLFLGRISPGVVSTGSIYTLDPYANDIVVADIAADAMSPDLRHSLVKQGLPLIAGKHYRIATIAYLMKRRDLFGDPETVTYQGITVRDALVDFVRDKDLSYLHA